MLIISFEYLNTVLEFKSIFKVQQSAIRFSCFSYFRYLINALIQWVLIHKYSVFANIHSSIVTWSIFLASCINSLKGFRELIRRVIGLRCLNNSSLNLIVVCTLRANLPYHDAFDLNDSGRPFCYGVYLHSYKRDDIFKHCTSLVYSPFKFSWFLCREAVFRLVKP